MLTRSSFLLATGSPGVHDLPIGGMTSSSGTITVSPPPMTTTKKAESTKEFWQAPAELESTSETGKHHEVMVLSM